LKGYLAWCGSSHAPVGLATGRYTHDGEILSEVLYRQRYPGHPDWGVGLGGRYPHLIKIQLSHQGGHSLKMGQNAKGGGGAGEQDIVCTICIYENNNTHTT